MKRIISGVARNGEPTLKLNNISLCSSFNPSKEAKTWVNSKIDFCSEAEVIFVLGLAAGYHSVELALRLFDKEIVVIEKNIDVTQWFWQNTETPVENLRVISIAKEKDYEKIRIELNQPYIVLENPYSLQMQPEYIKKLKERLLVRTSEELRLTNRYRIKHKVELNSQDLLSVKDVDVNFKKQELSREKAVWQALRELVR